MKRLLINFFLSLCFFLLKGHGHLYADTDQGCLYRSIKQHSESTTVTGLSDIRTTPPFINNIPARGAKKERIKATEVKDEDESISGRKYLQISNYRLVDPEETAAYCHYLKNPLPSCTHFSYYSSDKFIIHRVIRV